MKKFKSLFLFTFVFTFLTSNYTFAQDENDDEVTTFNSLINSIESFSGFGGPIFYFGSNNKDGYVLSGGGGAALFNKTYYFGGFGVSGNINTIDKADEPRLVDINYGGFWFGYIYNKDMLVHPTGSLKLGWGNAEIQNSGLSDNIFAIVPQVGAEINLTKWAKIELGLAYQLISGFNLVEIESSQLRKLQIGLDFKFGWFK